MPDQPEARELQGEMAGLRGEGRGEVAELRGETRSLLGAMDVKMATNVRLLVGGQIATIVLLGGWVSTVT